ncbi:MAG: GTP 3',8-cyclase MoaA [Gammaproteobacteria bacterium]|nr:GTP 3',8-cyclase MoaA [Gammaproteobacteria bacterium]
MALIDPFGRAIEYIRLSVTDRCDLRCFYCLPKGYKDFEEPDHWLSFAEITRVIRAFSELGVHRIRITGGEPLVRKNIATLAKKISQLPRIEDLSLSTNAVQLARHAQDLKAANISRLNVSLDSLDAKRFNRITNGGKLDKVIAGLMAAKQAGFHPVKINMVLMKDVNDDEVESMVEFCIKHGFTLRFIETMPIGDTGRNASNHFIDLEKIKTQLSRKYTLTPSVMHGGGPAQYLKIAGTDLNIGFITPISQHFCDTCNRVRLSVDGTLYLCLGQSDKLVLRPLLRQGISDQALKDTLIKAIALKPEKHEFSEKPEQVVRFMSMTGG